MRSRLCPLRMWKAGRSRCTTTRSSTKNALLPTSGCNVDWVAYKPPLPQYRWRLSSVAQFVFPQKDDAVIPKDINHVHMAQTHLVLLNRQDTLCSVLLHFPLYRCPCCIAPLAPPLTYRTRIGIQIGWNLEGMLSGHWLAAYHCIDL